MDLPRRPILREAGCLKLAGDVPFACPRRLLRVFRGTRYDRIAPRPRQAVPVKGRNPALVELRYTLHGPVIYEERSKNRAYALHLAPDVGWAHRLRWSGSEAGGAGYLPALSLARANNWSEFRPAADRYKVPSENMAYADRAGDIGWIAAGVAPIRKNWSGLFPVPGGGGEYEWS